MSLFSKTHTVTLAPLANTDALESFFVDLHQIVKSTQKGVILDLRSLSESPGLDFGYMIEKSWLSLTEKGLGMAIVVKEGLAQQFRDYTFARSDIACSISEAKELASKPPNIPKLSSHACQQLDKIEVRFRELVNKRIGHLWSDVEPPYPPVGRLYKCGVAKGHFPFPYGVFHWSIEETESGIRLEYDDYARVADGWGRAYELTSDETRLTAENLD